ncbi:hypothetical protein [Hymenobacter daeguensis]
MTLSNFSPQLHYAGPRPNPEMTWDFRLWKHQVRLALGKLCALDFPRGACGAEANDAGFRAAIRELYVESHFTEFLACEAWRQAGLDETTGRALFALQHQLNAYDEPDTDAAIVADPAWWAILDLALPLVKRLS